jgi:glycosyltransferase involved in cell wall biosynthesis
MIRVRGEREGVRTFGVVVPVLDEIRLLGRCLDALDLALGEARRRDPGLKTRLVVVDDGSADGSDRLVAARAGVELVRSAARNVGIARARGVREILGPHPERIWIATTDGDSRVPRDWAVEHLRHAAAGAGAVLGSVRPDPEDLDPASIARWQVLNPAGDGHAFVHGANLGVRGSEYLRAGGFEPVGIDEDVALAERLRAAGAVIVAIDTVPVVTSARTQGRAPDGFARYMRALVKEGVGGTT